MVTFFSYPAWAGFFSCQQITCNWILQFLSYSEMLAFTLTAFLELMDHGIVSWDMVSITFIKQVSLGGGVSGYYFFPRFNASPRKSTRLWEAEYCLRAQCTPFVSPHSPRVCGWQQLSWCVLRLQGTWASPWWTCPSCSAPWPSWRAWCSTARPCTRRLQRRSLWGSSFPTCKCECPPSNGGDLYQFFVYLKILLHLEPLNIIFF